MTVRSRHSSPSEPSPQFRLWSLMLFITGVCGLFGLFTALGTPLIPVAFFVLGVGALCGGLIGVIELCRSNTRSDEAAQHNLTPWEQYWVGRQLQSPIGMTFVSRVKTVDPAINDEFEGEDGVQFVQNAESEAF